MGIGQTGWFAEKDSPMQGLRNGLGFVGALLLGCGGGDAGKSGTQTVSEPAVTYHRDIRPVVEQNCTGCHKKGGIAPFELTSYDAVVPQQGAMVKAVGDGIMPPWRARADCHPLEGDRRLSAEDAALFAKWKDLDFPEGDPKTYEARPGLAGVTPPATDADIVIQMAEAYAAPPANDNTYQCFLLPYTFEKDTYVTAIDVHPDQKSTVHHVQIHTFPPSSLAAAQAQEAAGAGPGFPCAGGTVTGATNIYSWRPGATAVQMLPGDAMLVTAGTGVVIQVHYNLQGLAPGEAPPPDQSSIAFWTLPDGEKPDRLIVRRMVMAGLTGAPLLIKAGDAHMVSSADWPASLFTTVGTTQLDAEIVGQTPHMHNLGTRLSGTLKTAAGAEQCLIDVPDWSFQWQQDYLFQPDAAIKLAPNDILNVTCEYDNSPANQPVIQGQKTTPRDVGWGEGTYDEMCLNYSWIRFDRQAYEAARTPATPAPAPAP
jgi:hypothetical protein